MNKWLFYIRYVGAFFAISGVVVLLGVAVTACIDYMAEQARQREETIRASKVTSLRSRRRLLVLCFLFRVILPITISSPPSFVSFSFASFSPLLLPLAHGRARQS